MSGINKSKGGWLKHPKLPRPGETIGGGYFVFRRGDDTKRIRPSQWPFEYATEQAAQEQAQVLATENPGYVFQVVAVIATAFCEPTVQQAEDDATFDIDAMIADGERATEEISRASEEAA